jgi:predicted CXXCH cytochrome family protein
MHRSSSIQRRLKPNVAAVAIVLLFGVPLFAGQTYETSKHGDPKTGVLRIPELGQGACAQCHDNHGSRFGIPNAGPFDKTLFTVDDETLCYECHAVESAHHVYPGNFTWADSTHSTSPEAWWRGPTPTARRAEDAGKCVNCHDPHGADDADGVIPSMTRLREQTLCLGCHDGNAAKDIASQVTKLHGHPLNEASRHIAAEGNTNDPAQYDNSGIGQRRHAECADCHNPHVARADFFPPSAPEASQRLYGVPRVQVVNGAAGTIPNYVWRGADDLVGPLEYEVCFKCHSSWTQLPPGRIDLALLTNPNNASYHPIQAAGKNANIDPGSFENGRTWDTLVYCADCHGGDDPFLRGPHGSDNGFVLTRPYPASPLPATMNSTDLCFSCHRYDVYGDPLAPDATQQHSRFNRPANHGHAYHVGSQQVPCFACHATHGSVTQPSLIATGRNPGIVIYSQNAGGGSCTPTCHVTRSWTVTYGR